MSRSYRQWLILDTSTATRFTCVLGHFVNLCFEYQRGQSWTQAPKTDCLAAVQLITEQPHYWMHTCFASQVFMYATTLES